MSKRLLPLVLLAASFPASAATYNAFKDFHASTNPNTGTWVYGTEDTSSVFSRFTFKELVSGSLRSWSEFSLSKPFVRKNTSGFQVVSNNAVYPAKSWLNLHPGVEPADKYAVVRFQAPTAGNYTFDATFKSVRQGSTRATADVWVDVAGSPFWGDTINAFAGSAGKRAYYNVFLDAGQTLDFLVGPDDPVPPLNNGPDDIAVKIVIIDDQDGDGIEDSADTACPTAGLCAPDLIAGDLVITEIMYDPSVGPDSDNEWVEVYNTTATSIDLDGVTLKDTAGTTGDITGTAIVPSGQYRVIANGDGLSWAYDSPFDPIFFYGATPDINNSSEDKLTLRVGTTVIDATPKFNDPTGGNGVAYSLSDDSVDSVNNDDALNWCAADALDVIAGSNDSGTPGATNPVCP